MITFIAVCIFLFLLICCWPLALFAVVCTLIVNGCGTIF